MIEHNLTKMLLILDQAKCHQTEEIRAKAASLNIQLVFIPPGLTSNFFEK
jgi:transposase